MLVLRWLVLAIVFYEDHGIDKQDTFTGFVVL